MCMADTGVEQVKIPASLTPSLKSAPTVISSQLPRRRPVSRRRPILRHPADLRSLGFISIFYGCQLTLWWFDAHLAAAGFKGYFVIALIYSLQLLLAAVTVRPAPPPL